MKKKIASLFCLISSITYATENNNLHFLEHDLLAKEIEQIEFSQEYILLDGFLFDENRLVLLISYQNEEDNKKIEESSEESPYEIINYMEDSVLTEICSQEYIKELINKKEYLVSAEYSLLSGEKYMVRDFDNCN